MKRTIFISVFALIGTIAYSQSYDDFFTTYKDVSTQTKQKLLKTVDIRSPKTGISVHFSYSLPMAMQIY